MISFIEELREIFPLNENKCLSCALFTDNLINGHICYLCYCVTDIINKKKKDYYSNKDKFKILYNTNQFIKQELIKNDKINKFNQFQKIIKMKDNKINKLNKLNKFAIKHSLNQREISKKRYLIKRKYRNFNNVRYTKKQKISLNKCRNSSGRWCKK